MKVFLSQLILAARNDDFEGWMQILIVVIMAVVYGLGGILKAAKSKKLEGKKDQEQQGRPFDHAQGRQPVRQTHHPARPARTVVRRVYQAPSQPQRPKIAQPEPVKQAPTIAKETLLQLDVKIQEIPEITPKIEELPEFTDETIKVLEHQATVSFAPTSKLSHAAVLAETAKAVYFGQPLLDVSDPEAIRKAILHYEIFGKPLSLRDSGK